MSSLLSPLSFLLSRFISSSSSLSFLLFLSLHSALVFFSPLSRLRSPLSYLLFRIPSLISFLSFPFPAPVSAFLSDLFSFPSPFSPLPFPFQSPFFPQAPRTIYEHLGFLLAFFGVALRRWSRVSQDLFAQAFLQGAESLQYARHTFAILICGSSKYSQPEIELRSEACICVGRLQMS